MSNETEDASALVITVTRSGGVGGMSPRWTVTAEEDDDVTSWLELVDSCPWDAPTAEQADERTESATGEDPAKHTHEQSKDADRFVYTIRVLLNPEREPKPPQERDARIPERQLEGPWRDLVRRVRDTSGR